MYYLNLCNYHKVQRNLVPIYVKKYESEGKIQDVQIPAISVDARMIHTDSCSILWIGQNYRKGDDYETIFGIDRISSLPALSREVVNELIDTIL